MQETPHAVLIGRYRGGLATGDDIDLRSVGNPTLSGMQNYRPVPVTGVEKEFYRSGAAVQKEGCAQEAYLSTLLTANALKLQGR